MNVQRWRFSNDYASGTYTNSTLDTAVYLSVYNHPSLISTNAPSAITTLSGAALLASSADTSGVLPWAVLNTSNVWTGADTLCWTRQSGDSLSFSTSALQVTVQLTGALFSGLGLHAGTGLTSNELRNGAVANVYVDGTLETVLDCYNTAPRVTLYLDGAAHTVKITHSGGYNSAVQPIGPVTALNTVGATNTVLAGLTVTAQFHPTFASGTWRVLATGAGTYSLYFTPPGGVEALVQAGLTTGTTYTTYVNGCSLVLSGSLTTNDSATFTTDVTMVGIAQVQLGTGTGGASTYTSGVVDSGSVSTQWFLAEWDQSGTMASFALATGNTAVPDNSWVTTLLTPSDSVNATTGVHHGIAGLMGAARGRYARWIVTLPAIGTAAAWLRDLSLYYWVPEADPFVLSRMPLGASPGPTLLAYVGTLALTLAATRQAALDFVASYSAGQAVDQYLQAYAADAGLVPYTAEPPQALRTRTLATIVSHQQGGSLPFIAQWVATLVNGASSAVTVTVSGGKATASSGGVVATQLSSQQYAISIPPAGTAGYPGLLGVPVGTPATVGSAQYIIAQFVSLLNPVGSVISPNNSSSNLTFN